VLFPLFFIELGHTPFILSEPFARLLEPTPGEHGVD
jgi:hypothetical protein